MSAARVSGFARGHQQTKNLLVSYSPKKLGFFQEYEKTSGAGAG
ncbi:hypothetical protein ACGF5F_28340 [Streptomyces sp. NPDC047821]